MQYRKVLLLRRLPRNDAIGREIVGAIGSAQDVGFL